MAENRLVNGPFENGWAHGIERRSDAGWHSFRPRIDGDPPGIQEIKVPLGGWQIIYADETVPNPYWDGEEHNRFRIVPHFDVVHRDQIPEHEQDDYFRDGDWCVKPYGKAWLGGYSQIVYLPPGEGVLRVPLFADLVDHYENDAKVWATDPISGNIRFFTGFTITDWMTLEAGKRHEPSTTVFNHDGGEIKIGFELLCPFALENSGFFIDNVTLLWSESQPAVKQYHRVIHKVPNDVTEAEMAVVDAEIDPTGTRTGSADEALHNALAFESREIHWWGDPSRHGFKSKWRIRKWAERHHPPAPRSKDLIMREFEPVGWKRYLLLQCDDAWGEKLFGSADYQTTLCRAGCYLTDLAAAKNILEDPTIFTNPAEVVDLLDHDDYVLDTARVWWASVKEKLGLQISRLGDTRPVDWLGAGNLLLLRVNHKGNEHWVLVVEWDGVDYIILNPLTGFVGQIRNEYPEGGTIWRKLALVEETSPPSVILPPPAETITFHIQKEVPGLRRYFNRVQPEWALLVGNAEWAHWLKGEGVKNVAYRRHENNQKPWYALEGFATYRDAAIDWVAGPRYALETNPIDCYLGLNEEIPTGNLVKLRKVLAFEEALSDYCFSIWGKDKKAALIGAATGNPEHSEVAEMLKVTAAAYRNGHIIHYHEYGPCHPLYWLQWTKNEGYHYHLRALLSWDPVFTAAGYFLPYLGTEDGPIGAAPRMQDGLWRPGGMNAAKGWWHPDCLNGNLEHMLQWTEITRGQKLNWNKDNGNRHRGSAQFTINAQGADEPAHNWPYFRYTEYELDAMAEQFS